MVEQKGLFHKKNFLSIFGIFIIVSLIVLVAAVVSVLWGTSTTTPVIQDFGNYSGLTNFNCSFSTGFNDTMFPNVTFSYNASNGNTGLYGVGVSNISSLNYSFNRTQAGGITSYNVSFDTSSLLDGKTYNITCFGILANGSNLSVSAKNITIDNTPPNLVFFSLLNNSNYSKHYLFILNATATDTTTNVSSVWYNISNESTKQINYNISTLKQGYYNVTLNISNFVDGLYNITVSANDTAFNYSLGGNTNITKIQIRIDSVVPRVFVSNVVSLVNYSNYSGNFVLNITGISDASSSIGSVVFSISNATGIVNTTLASSSVNGSWNATFNTSALGEGIYNITYIVNDSAENQNASVVGYNVLFDNTPPVVTFSCSPKNSALVGDTVTCTCSATDALAGVNSTVYTSTPDTSDSGTFTPVCYAYDTAGNVGNNTYSYTVNEVPAPSNSGGSSSTPTATKNELWSQITPSAPVTITNFANGTGVNQIEIEVSQAASNVQVTVDKYDSKPSAVSTEKTGAYSYLHINTVNLADKLSKATVKLQVAKSWVSSQNIAKTDVALFRFDNSSNTWNALTTTFASEDSSYYYYTVELSSFSYFAIASNAQQQANNTGDQTSTTGTPAPTGFWGLPYWVWMIIGTVVLAIIVWVGISLAKKRK